MKKLASLLFPGIKKPVRRHSHRKSGFECPQTKEGFYEGVEPILNGDTVNCPHCRNTHRVSAPIGGGIVNRHASGWHAKQHGFRFYRSDRGAVEFVATRETRSGHWVMGKDERILGYAIGECIFWPSTSSARQEDLFLHELCHVRQSRKHGEITFVVKYWLEHLRNGYGKNKYERHARSAERRANG